MDTRKTEAQRANDSVGASEYLGVLAGEVNEAMRRMDEVLAEYERIKPLIELAASNPNYRLAVVDSEPPANPCSQVLRDAYTHYNYRRVVKTEGK